MLSRKNSRQPSVNISRNGRFTANHVTSAVIVVRPHSATLPALRHSTSRGPSRNSGYSLAAAPSPMSTPASAGLRLDQASSPHIASATATVSKLVNACTITSGEIATSAASHGLRAEMRAVAQIAVSQAAASSSAVMLKYTATGSAPGSRPESATFIQPCVSLALTHWNRPVSTGYSMYRRSCSPPSVSSVQCVA